MAEPYPLLTRSSDTVDVVLSRTAYCRRGSLAEHAAEHGSLEPVTALAVLQRCAARFPRSFAFFFLAIGAGVVGVFASALFAPAKAVTANVVGFVNAAGARPSATTSGGFASSGSFSSGGDGGGGGSSGGGGSW